jgi:hypothetical protein
LASTRGRRQADERLSAVYVNQLYLPVRGGVRRAAALDAFVLSTIDALMRGLVMEWSHIPAIKTGRGILNIRAGTMAIRPCVRVVTPSPNDRDAMQLHYGFDSETFDEHAMWTSPHEVTERLLPVVGDFRQTVVPEPWRREELAQADRSDLEAAIEAHLKPGGNRLQSVNSHRLARLVVGIGNSVIERECALHRLWPSEQEPTLEFTELVLERGAQGPTAVVRALEAAA